MSDDDRDEPEPVEIPIDGTLDLHAFHPHEVKGLVRDYLEACRERGILEARLVHGKGIGAVRETVNSVLRTLPWVTGFRPGGTGAGGWGATLVDLAPPEDGPSAP